LFYRAIKAVDKGIDSEEIKEIQEKIKEKRKEIAENLNNYLYIIKTIKKFVDRNDYDGLKYAVKIVTPFIKYYPPELGKELVEKYINNVWFNEDYDLEKVAKIVAPLAEYYPDLGKKIMEKCFKKEKNTEGTEIAAFLAKHYPDLAKKIIENYIKENLDWSDKVNSVLCEYYPDLAKKIIEKCINRYEVRRESFFLKDIGKVATRIAEHRPDLVKEILIEKIKIMKKEEYIKKDKLEAAAELTVPLTKHYPDLATIVIKKCAEVWLWGSVNKICYALAKHHPDLTKELIKEFISKELLYSAIKISSVLVKYHPESSEIIHSLINNYPNLIRECINDLIEGESFNIAADVASAFVEYYPDLAKKVIEKCIWHWRKKLNEAAEVADSLAKIHPEIVSKIMWEVIDKHINKHDWDDCDRAVKIAEPLAKYDPDSVRSVLDKLVKGNHVYCACKFATILAPYDPAFVKQVILKLYYGPSHWRWYDLDEYTCETVGVLAKYDPSSAIDFMWRIIRNPSGGEIDKIADTLAQYHPDLAKENLEKCIKEGYIYNASIIATSLAKNFRVTVTPETERLIKIINETEWSFYGINMISSLINQNQDLGLFKEEYLPKYLFLKKFAKEVNEKIEESKKWKNLQEFFDKHNLDIVNLHLLDLNLSTQLLKNHISRGLSFAESYLDVFGPVLDNELIVKEIKEYIKSNKNLDGYNLSDLLEISSAYISTKNENLLIELLKNNKGKDFKELKSELNKNLLKKVAESLGIKAEIPEQELKNWKIKYFANLITNQEIIKKRLGEYYLELYNKLLNSVFENRFDEFISNLDQKDEFGREIAKHNKKVEEEFKEKGIDWDNWINFKEQVLMTIGTQKKQNMEALFNQFEERFKEWQEKVNKFEPRLKSSLEKDLTQLKQKKKEFDFSKIDLSNPNWLEEFLPTYTKSLNYLKSKNPNYNLPVEVEETFNHLLETIKTLSQKQKREQTAKKEFIVKIWDRDPRKDMFQGNQTHCCIAVGVKEAPPGGGLPTLHPETIFQYLIDKGIQVAEVVDPDTGDVVAQTWLFVTLDKNGKPVLVADNFEVNNRYPAGDNVNRGIREAMFQFLKKYAKACNIEKVVLGKVGTNDVETGDLKTIELPPIKKLGGYFNDEKYYLETLDHTEAYEIG
jgi:hypothetical protein